MSAKHRRLTFSAPLVMTLAVAPGCLVTTSRPSPVASPSTTSDPQDPQADAPPTTGIIMNPPQPDRRADTTPPPVSPTPRTEPGEPVAPTPMRPMVPVQPIREPIRATVNLRGWTVTIDPEKNCWAHKVISDCPPNAMCNPPPASAVKLKQCPVPMPTDGVKIQEHADKTCWVEYPMPKCAPNVVCNPPRSGKIACPE